MESSEKSTDQKEMVYNKQRIFFVQREAFLHKTSQQVLEAGPPEGQLQAQPSGSLFIVSKKIYQVLLSFGLQGNSRGKTKQGP